MSALHFACNPEEPIYGAPVRALCGETVAFVTNWNVENVTCERCLEVMEERAAGIEKVTRVHDETIVERKLAGSGEWEGDPFGLPYKPWKQEYDVPKPFPFPADARPSFSTAFFTPTFAQEMAAAFKRDTVLAKLIKKQREDDELKRRAEEMLARVKKMG